MVAGVPGSPLLWTCWVIVRLSLVRDRGLSEGRAGFVCMGVWCYGPACAGTVCKHIPSGRFVLGGKRSEKKKKKTPCLAGDAKLYTLNTVREISQIFTSRSVMTEDSWP